MPAATMTSKGQVTLPKPIRDFLGIDAGDQVEFSPEPDGTVRLRRMGRSIRSLAGMLHRSGMQPASIREMDEAVGTYLAQDDERIRRGL